jgi:mannobiose 2-epimerase
MQTRALRDLGQRAETELRSDILPFWLTHAIDRHNGGFYGRIANDLTIVRRADKGLALNARILSTFSRVLRVYGDEVYRRTADRAYAYLMSHFRDGAHGGFFSAVDPEGRVVDTSKRACAQASCIHALAEYHLATGDPTALSEAVRTYEFLESFARDTMSGGYFEIVERSAAPTESPDVASSKRDESKSITTHLSVLDGYTNLVHAWGSAELRGRVREVLRIFLDRILHPSKRHLRLLFDESWKPRSDRVSFGHDLEVSWLLVDAAEVANAPSLLAEVQAGAVHLAEAALMEGVDADGGILSEAGPSGPVDGDKLWWSQAEAVVGFLGAFELTRRAPLLEAAMRTWGFIERAVLDRDHGEWFAKVSPSGEPNRGAFKVDESKCPYHGTRACLEIMARTERMTSRAQLPGPVGRRV